MEFMDLIEIPRVDNVKYCKMLIDEQKQMMNQFCDGSLCLTSHHLIFSPKEKVNQEIWIQHSLIDLLEPKIRETKFQVVLKLKNFQMYLIDFPGLYACQSITKSLSALSNITSENMRFPFFYSPSFKLSENGWDLYSTKIDFDNTFGKEDSCEWRLSDVNEKYNVCNTYSKKVVVPKNITDAMLIKSSQFRSGGRFPVLSYYHKPTKSFMMRCGQPLLGSSKKRCKEDETILKSPLQIGKKGYIFDLRDFNTMKNAKSKGGGYETEACYPLWTRINKHCERFDSLHQSLSKFIDACCGDYNSAASNIDKWLSKLESSNWFNNIRQILHVAVCISDEMHNKNGCVLVHGSDGTDNTLIITSLVQLILNPKCRTIKGFEMLIEKEWLHAGHPFFYRNFKSAYGNTSQKSEGPVFLLFLECTKQLMDQFCLSFEFNEDFLILLFDNSYASEFGTFLGLCELDREKLFLSSRTTSLWSYINHSDNLNNYKNPLYEKNLNVLWPSLFSQSINLWSNLYMRFQRDDEPFKEAKSEILQVISDNEEAHKKVEKIRAELISLRKEAESKGVL